jgi:signal transduction histidine kinase
MSRLSYRTRLTIVYSGLVLVAGILLIGITYALVNQRLPQVTDVPNAARAGVAVPPGEVGGETTTGTIFFNGKDTSAEDLPLVVRQETMSTLLTQGGIALGVVTVIAGGFAYLISGRMLQPLQRITETAKRIGMTGPQDEVRQLADTFDTMLERLDHSFESQRRFVANASHELRTPLAINRALVEVAVTRPDASDDAKRLGESLLVVNGRHERLIDGLLTLADSENEVTEHRPVDLADVAGHLVDTARPRADDEAVTLRRPKLGEAPTAGDPVLLERLVQNLVENAIRHNSPGGWVSVETGATKGSAVVTVSNTGPVVPKYEVESLFQPFRRLTGERTTRERGFGLGLSIVRAVARAHGGAVKATPRDAEAGGGLVVEVKLPRHPRPDGRKPPAATTRARA